MADVLLTLVLPVDIAQSVEDLLLSRPDLAPGFTAGYADGHGSGVELATPSELVAGHAPRTTIRIVGVEKGLREILALLKAEIPRGNIFYYLVPVIEAGRL